MKIPFFFPESKTGNDPGQCFYFDFGLSVARFLLFVQKIEDRDASLSLPRASVRSLKENSTNKVVNRDLRMSAGIFFC